MRRIKVLLFVVPLIFSAFISAAQDHVDKYRLILSPGLSYQKDILAELNLMYAQTAVNYTGFGFRGPRLGVETNFSSTNFTFAPKLGYELSVLFLCLRGSAVGYVDNTKELDLRLLPEAGLSFFGLANLTYGYGIPLLSYEARHIGRHRLALSFNLSCALWSDLFGH